MLQLMGNGLPGSNRVQVAVNQPVRELWFTHERVQTPPLQEVGQAVVVKQWYPGQKVVLEDHVRVAEVKYSL